ncbi:MAG: T9SS type A sorting domain-containing protein [candidate division Zixibacteria bacterium]|nr:T9SS type A sorting domain-containing protein [candidate division Zixibacteria bacterium]
MSDFKITILLAMLLMIALFSGATLSSANQADGGRDSPIICIPSNSTIIIDTVYAFPGQDRVVVPVYFEADGGDSLREFEFEIVVPPGLDYADAVIDDADWEGSIISLDSGSYLEIQGYGDTLSDDATFKLVDLRFAVDEMVDHDSTMNLSFQPDVYFKIVGGEEGYDPDEVNGWVTTYGDSCWVDVDDSITAYSYQALDTSSSRKDTLFLEVPVEIYAGFPCSEFKFWYQHRSSLADSGIIYAGYDTSSALYNAVATEDSLWIQIDNIADPSTFEESGSFTLITLYFRVGDFHSEYNDTVAFDSLLQIIASYDEDDYLLGEDSEYEYDLDATNFFDGSAYLPQYNLEIDVGNDDVPLDSSVTVPVKMRPDFWAQFYELFISYDSRDLELTGITAGGGIVPDDISYGYEDTSSADEFVIWVKTSSISDDEYIYPHPTTYYTLFNLNFDVKDSLLNNPGDSTEIFVNKQTDVSEVRDYFPPESDTSLHVRRYSTGCDNHFTTYPGFVYMPAAKVTADTHVHCEEDSANVPVRVQWIKQNSYDRVFIDVVTKGPLKYRGIIPDDTDFKIEWGTPEITDKPSRLTVTGAVKAGKIDGPGILLLLAMAEEDPKDEVTEVMLEEVRFYQYSSPLNRLYADLVNGDVESCDGGKEGRTVIPSIPQTHHLAQNHPNPFNASTYINFYLANNDHVTLEIFDILGRKVKKLLSADLVAGDHQISWDCTNENGSSVGSGFYIYRLYTNDFSRSRKMLLMK